MPTVKVNDIQMYYEIHGEGKPLLLIGGLGLDLSELQSMSGWLAQRYQVIVFDNRGAGRTDKSDVPYSIEMMAEDTAELMKALAIERASLLGISMGGKIALDLALRYPGRVEKLILVSTSARVINTKEKALALTFPRSCIQPASVPEQAPLATLRLSSTTPGIGQLQLHCPLARTALPNHYSARHGRQNRPLCISGRDACRHTRLAPASL